VSLTQLKIDHCLFTNTKSEVLKWNVPIKHKIPLCVCVCACVWTGFSINKSLHKLWAADINPVFLVIIDKDFVEMEGFVDEDNL